MLANPNACLSLLHLPQYEFDLTRFENLDVMPEVMVESNMNEISLKGLYMKVDVRSHAGHLSGNE